MFSFGPGSRYTHTYPPRLRVFLSVFYQPNPLLRLVKSVRPLYILVVSVQNLSGFLVEPKLLGGFLFFGGRGAQKNNKEERM